MKTKLLFTAALMAATVGTQAVPSTGSSMLVQLLESQRLESNVEVLAEGEETSVDVPTPIASYDFEEETANVTFKHFGTGVAPYSVPLSETEKGLQFTGSGNQDMGYIQIVNPFKDNTNIEANGATVSLWVYCDGTANNSIWGFGLGTDGYEDQNTSGMLGFQANTYMVYNMAKVGGPWIDFNGGPGGAISNAIPQKQMAMITMTFASTDVSFYVNGQKVEGYAPASSLDNKGSEYYPGILGYLKTHFTHFYVGKGTFTGTFSGKADKLGFYDKALTADEVKALYDSQKEELVQEIEDVTEDYVTNADFSDGVEGWNTGGPTIGGLEEYGIVDVNVTQYNYWGAKVFDFNQVLTDLPLGLYRLSAQVSTTTPSEELHLTSSMGDSRVGFGSSGMAVADAAAKWANDKEANRVYTGNVLVIDGTATIGMNRHNSRNGEVYFDNFRLEKVGDGFIELADMYANLKNEAEALDKDALASELKTRLETALAATPSTSEEYVSAYTALDAVVDLCNAYISECPIATLISTCEAYSQNSVSTSATKATFDTAIAAAEAVDLSTVDINGLREAYNALEAARQAFVQNAVPTGEQEFDMTFLLTNPDLTNLPAWTQQAGWYTDTDKGIQCMENAEVASEDGKSHFYEIYAGSKTPMPAGNILYQKVVLQPGDYRMTAYAYGKGVNDNYTGAFSGCLFADEAKGETFAYDRLTQSEVSFVQATEKEIKLGLYSDGTGAANWAGIGYMKLYKLAPEAVALALDETQVYSVTTNTYANVTLTRTLKSDGKWNTFCVPFDMTAEQLEANGITDVRALESATVEGESVTLNFSGNNVNAVEAGVPYLVKVDASYDGTINVENVLVSAAEPTTVSVEGGVSMTGNYAAGFVPQYAYFISDNAFYYADEANYVSLKGFRAYIQLNNGVQNANRLMINLDGEVTGIEDVLGEEATEADKLVNVVSLDGMTVKAGVKKSEALDGLQKGIYIVDGKKYVVK